MSVDCRDVDQVTGNVTNEREREKIYIRGFCVDEVGVLCAIDRFPFTGRENKSSGPFFAVMSGEQVLGFKTV